MNILFILKQFPRYGGVEKMTITLSNSLVKIGYNVCILSLFKGNKCEYMSRLDSKVVCLNMPNEKLFSRENGAIFCWFCRRMKSMLLLIKIWTMR